MKIEKAIVSQNLGDPGNLVFDIGANHGDDTRLSRALTLDLLIGRVRLRPAAVGDRLLSSSKIGGSNFETHSRDIFTITLCLLFGVDNATDLGRLI